MNLKILFWNLNDKKYKTNELHQLILQQNISIIFLNKTHIKPSLFLKIQNFITYRNDLQLSPRSQAHGVAAILVQRLITHQPAHLNTNLQSTNITIRINNKSLLISSIYKPPSAFLGPIG